MNRKENASLYDKSDIIGGEFYELDNDAQEWSNLYGNKEFKVQQNTVANDLMEHLKKLEPILPKSINC